MQDDGGTADGGVDTDPTPNTLTFNIGAVNDRPTGTSKTINPALDNTLAEDQTYTLKQADFGFSDALDNPPNAFQAVVMVSVPVSGTLFNNGSPITAGLAIPVTAITANQITFKPAADANNNNTPAPFFTFKVRDDGGTANGPCLWGRHRYRPLARTMTFNVTPVNDAPLGTSTTVSTPENTDKIFAPADFGYADPADKNDVPTQTFQAVIIPAAPSSGTLVNNGAVVTTFPATITFADINTGKFAFRPATNINGPATFTFQVQDSGSGIAPSVNTDPTPKTMTVNVTSVNSPPSAPKTISMFEDVPYQFTQADFGFSDPNDVPSNGLAAIRLTSLPGVGTITDNGVAVSQGQLIPVTDLAGNLRYQGPLNASGNGLRASPSR